MKNTALSKKSMITVMLFFLLIAFGITCYSSSLIHLTSCPSYDSYAYRYMGMLMAKGGIPYRDGFDNKGPVMYIINWLGYLLGKEYGIFWVELIFVFAFLAVQYRLALKFVSGKIALLLTITSVASLSVFFAGNWTEEYALLFIAAGIYVFVDYFVFDDHKWYKIVICGMTFTCALFLRPNMVAPWFVMVIAVIVHDICKNKRFPLILSLQFIAGMCIVMIPIMTWLGINGAFEEMWKDLVLSNFIYTTDHAVVPDRPKVFMDFLLSSNMEIYIGLLIYMIIKKKNSFFNVFYIAFMVLNLYLISMKGVKFDNYAMTIVPSLLYPLASFYKYFIADKEKKTRQLFAVICVVMSVMLPIFVIKNIFNCIRGLSEGNPYNREDEFIVSQIIANTEPDDRILVLGYKCFYYVASDRLSSTIFYYNTNNYGYPDGHQAVIDAVNEELPKLIVVEGGDDPEDLFSHYDQYHMIDNNPMLWILNE